MQLKTLPEKITKETFMGKHVKGIMYFSFFSLKIYCQTVQPQNARLSQLQIKMSSSKDCIFSEVRRENYTGLCRNIVVEKHSPCFKCVFLKLKPTVTFEFVHNIPPAVINSGQNKITWICRPRVYWCNGSKFDWPMKDMSINQKKWAEGISKRNLVRLYFSFRQLHITYHAELK